MNYYEVSEARKSVSELVQKHNDRMAKNPEFIALNEDLKVRNERRERKFLSLNYQKRKAENDKDDEKRLKDINERFKREGKKPLKDIDDLPKDYEAPDFFLKEAAAIAADMVKFEQKKAEIKQADKSANQ